MKLKYTKIESHESLEINLGSPCVYNYDTFFLSVYNYDTCNVFCVIVAFPPLELPLCTHKDNYII